MQTSIHTPSIRSRFPTPSPPRARAWPEGWWKLMEIRIGIIPLPVYFILLALIVGFSVTGKVPGEISMAIAVLAFFGFTCAELGKRLPLLRNIGAAAIFATFVPSALTYYHVLPKPVLNLTVEFTKSTNFLYLFIASIIVGSILSMDRRVLIQGFVKIFIPLAAGSVAAAIVGTAVGTALGLGARHTLLHIVVPIMAGGVGEGAIPLSIGYSELMHLPQGEMFAMVLPPVMLGSLTAIILSGALDMLGKRFPAPDRQRPPAGRRIGRHDARERGNPRPRRRLAHRGRRHHGHHAVPGGLMAHKLFGLPAPVAMLFLAVLVKLARAVSPPLQEGAFVVYKFFSTAVTYPLLFAIGVAMTPWDKLTAAFTIVNVVTIVSTVATLMGTGFVVGRLMKMYPIDTAS